MKNIFKFLSGAVFACTLLLSFVSCSQDDDSDDFPFWALNSGGSGGGNNKKQCAVTYGANIPVGATNISPSNYQSQIPKTQEVKEGDTLTIPELTITYNIVGKYETLEDEYEFGEEYEFDCFKDSVTGKTYQAGQKITVEDSMYLVAQYEIYGTRKDGTNGREWIDERKVYNLDLDADIPYEATQVAPQDYRSLGARAYEGASLVLPTVEISYVNEGKRYKLTSWKDNSTNRIYEAGQSITVGSDIKLVAQYEIDETYSESSSNSSRLVGTWECTGPAPSRGGFPPPTDGRGSTMQLDADGTCNITIMDGNSITDRGTGTWDVNTVSSSSEGKYLSITFSVPNCWTDSPSFKVSLENDVMTMTNKSGVSMWIFGPSQTTWQKQ